MSNDITPIKKVALAGASGPVGTAILNELLSSHLFTITILTRSTNTTPKPFPTSPLITILPVDYTSLPSLTTALSGHDALISAIPADAQHLLISAAISAGVQRIIPSEFSQDIKNPHVQKLKYFTNKLAIAHLLDAAAIKGETSYTLLFCGPILEICLKPESALFLDFPHRSIDIYDGGSQKISVSRLNTVGKAVRRILTHPRETADRGVWVKDLDITQQQLLEIAKGVTKGEEWVLKEKKTNELREDEEGRDGLLRAVFREECGSHFQHVHNSVLGITEMSEMDLEDLVEGVLLGKK